MDHEDGDEDGDGDGAGLGGGVDGDSGGGMEKTSRGGSGGISPLRSSPAAAFSMLKISQINRPRNISVSGFVFLLRLLLENLGRPFI